jgi:predicted permease
VSCWTHSLRRLGRAPAFTAAALLTLGLGIGANTSIFSAIYSLLLRPLHYPEPDRLVALSLTKQDKSRLGLSLNTIADWRGQTRTLETVAGGITRSFGLTASGSSVAIVLAGMVTSDFQAVLGMPPALGRGFSEEEERQAAPVAILTDGLWRARFGADPNILGQRLELNEQPRTIIGVLPPGFDFPIGNSIPDLLIPINHADYGRRRGAGHLRAIGRLQRGSSALDAQQELDRTMRRLAQSYPEDAGLGAAAEPLAEALRGPNRRPLLLLAAAGLLLLLIACANVTSLLLAQLLARSREVAIRVSLGAGVRDLAQEFLADGLTLSALGAAAGLLFAGLLESGLPLALGYAGVNAPKPVPVEFPALAFAAVTLAATSLIFALIPTLIARKSDPSQLIKSGAHPGAARSRLRAALVIGQVALSMTLLLCAGLLARSFFKLMSVDPGFRTDRVFEFGIGIPEARYNTERKIAAFHSRLIRGLSEIPGVESAAFMGRPPLTGGMGTDFEFETSPVERHERPRVPVNVVSPGYLRTLSIPLSEGRDFSEHDLPETPRVALVNEAFVRAYSPRQSPIGRRIRTGFENGELNPGGALSEIVGVAGDVRQFSLEIAPAPQVYLCSLQYGLEGGAYVLRTTGGGAGFATAVQAAVSSVDPRLETIRVRPMSEFVRRNLGDRRVAALLLAMLSIAALALTAVGIYGVISLMAAQRMREMAVRVALGARSWQVAALIVGQGIALTAMGIIIGGLGSLWAGSLLRSQLYETSAIDPLALSIAAALLLITAAGACAAPAWRVVRAPLTRLLAG